MDTLEAQVDAYVPVKAAIRQITSLCDGAVARDGQGWSKVDAYLGDRLAALPDRSWTPEQLRAGYEMLRRYRGQLLGFFGVDYDTLPVPPGTRRSSWRELFTSPAQARPAPPQRPHVPFEISDFDRDFDRGGGRKLRIQSEMLWDNPDHVSRKDAIKSIRGSQFSTNYGGAAWYLPYTEESVNGLLPVIERYVEYPDEAERALAFLRSVMEELEGAGLLGIDPNRVELRGDTAALYFEYGADRIEARRKLLPAARFKGEEGDKHWEVPLSLAECEGLAQFCARFEIAIPDDLAERMLEVVERSVANREASRALAVEADFEIPGFEGELRPFQKAGVAYLRSNPRALLADSMGLGKTCSAIAGMLTHGVHRFLVVCPASLKYNWRNELARWAPGLTSVVVMGRKHADFTADVVIVNYDLLPYLREELSRQGFGGMIVDESHYIKSSKAQRSKAVAQLAKSINGPLFLLTGTPVLNRPVELTNQLDVLGVLKTEFGGFFPFARRYCEAYQDTWGWHFDGAANLDELSDRLRRTCMIRRTTREVFSELPEIQRVIVPVEITNRAEYERAEEDLLDYVASLAANDRAFRASIAHLPREEQDRLAHERANDAAEKAARAETLVRIGTLRQVALRGKLAAIKEWVEDWNEQAGPDDKLLTFAYHKEAQSALAEMLPGCVTIFGDDSAAKRQASVEAFQGDPNVKHAVLSIMAAGVGLTLTRAWYELFTEYAWRPGDHTQAEARAFGRVNDPHPVVAYYVQGVDTIDEWMGQLIEQKRAVADAVTGDAARSVNDGSIEGELLAFLRNRASDRPAKRGKRARGSKGSDASSA
jgi:SWI/SNF-related matrix-associated actin-dependent regulator 1 of chromatin subfamily A